jgi:2-methylcitrate dehydratase PrpD
VTGPSNGQADLLSAAARHVVATAKGARDADRAIAVRCVMHHLACSLAGASLPWSQAAVALAFDHACTPDGAIATVVGSARRTGPGAAIFANAVLGQSTLAEDIHPENLVHVGSIVIPVALAVGERIRATGAQFLDAVVAGYDVVSRMATAMKTPTFVRRGFRPSGVFAPFGAAATAAALLDLNEDQTLAALAIAANTCAGLREWANGGTTDVYFQNGFGARNGYDSVLLAIRGVTGASSALTGAAGMGVAYSGDSVDWAAAVSDLQRESAMREIQFKRFPACSGVQTAIQLALMMYRDHGPAVEDIKRVTIRTHSHGKHNPGCDNPGPWSDIGQAQMSNQLGVAIALAGRQVQISDYAAYADATLARLAARIEVIEDPAYTAVYPGRSPVAIVIEFASGAVLRGQLADEEPLGPDEVLDNFRDVVSTHYKSPTSDTIIDKTTRLDQLTVIGELTKELRLIEPS